jgi:hypothetical protein
LKTLGPKLEYVVIFNGEEPLSLIVVQMRQRSAFLAIRVRHDEEIATTVLG